MRQPRILVGLWIIREEMISRPEGRVDLPYQLGIERHHASADAPKSEMRIHRLQFIASEIWQSTTEPFKVVVNQVSRVTNHDNVIMTTLINHLSDTLKLILIP